MDFIERATKKIKNNAHQEMNRNEILEELEKNLRLGRDILKREYRSKLSIRSKEPRFRCKPLEQCTPHFVMKNQEKFKHLIFK